MKKNGFTLAEILLSLAIIGIVAAITAPSLLNLIPNKDKTLTIKYHKLISEITYDLVNNRSLFSEGELDNKYETILDSEYKLPLIEQEKLTNLKKNKYGYLLSERLELDDSETPSFTTSKAKFKTTDGNYWEIPSQSFPKTILIDKNGTEGPNKVGAKLVKQPDRFIFRVLKDGTVECDPSDKITCQYLKNRYNLSGKKDDYEAAF